MSTYAYNLNEVRDSLLRDYMLATGEDKVEILAKIMELDEEIEEIDN
ncbi:MAG: hypothetical protein ACOX4N_05635 [Dethiobacteraceae bacterium]|jgi:hypothetical protein|nr:hypothetical protein [Bacillota bacterium]